MEELMTSWAATRGFMPHGHCFLWTPALLWSFIASESVIVV